MGLGSGVVPARMGLFDGAVLQALAVFAVVSFDDACMRNSSSRRAANANFLKLAFKFEYQILLLIF